MVDAPGIDCRAAGLLGEIGLSRHALLPLSGGGNNRVYRVTGPSENLLLKEYFRHPQDRRDRLGAEFGFARFAWEQGVRCIPEPVACDPGEGLALYRFIEGTPVGAGEVTSSDVDQAAEFARTLDQIRLAPGAQALPDASEACFSLAAHLDLVEQRLGRLVTIAPETGLDRDAVDFAQNELCTFFGQLRVGIESALARRGIPAVKELTRQERTLSPSDFGFHNALRQKDGTLVFLDFEYAGWDDPAKLISDFFCQVAVPVPPLMQERFRRAATVERPNSWLDARLQLLMPLCRVKWCSIVLNHFLPVAAARRRFASGEIETKKRRQLELARNLLSLAKETPIIHEGV